MTLYSNDFDADPVGPYTRASLEACWPGVRWDDGVSAGRVAVVERAEPRAGRALRVSYPRGAVGPARGGAQWLMPLAPREQLFLEYRLRFAPGFDFVLGGKLPGLVGGGANSGGSPPNGHDGWSARMMWRAGGKVVQYVYHPDQAGVWGDDLAWDRGGERRFVAGRWHHVRHEVVMNTVGQRDGLIRGWFDGELALEAAALRFRDTPQLAIDQFYFSTFFGGNDATWAPVKDEFIDFDDFLISASALAPA